MHRGVGSDADDPGCPRPTVDRGAGSPMTSIVAQVITTLSQSRLPAPLEPQVSKDVVPLVMSGSQGPVAELASQWPAMSSRDQAGCVTRPRGANSLMYGFRSSTGVPSITSKA